MNNNIKVVEYTQGVGRSLNNIRNYNQRTTLHTKLPEKRSRARSEDDASPSQAIPAIVINTNAALASANIYNVHLYDNGYNNTYTGTAYMFLPETSYGRNVPNGTRLMVYRQMIDTTVGSIGDDETSGGEGDI